METYNPADMFLGLAVIWSCMVVYFIPTFIAVSRHSDKMWPVFVCNLIVGWTGVFWIIALILATWPIPPRETYRR